ncbi:hypothetical protein [Alishewanella jeotgali]|uniref:CRISPR-associated helicase Cas3 domain protein n=1 Tax=Alishewanella jeotgali KCTC 22429 TaxID=1129374 RepID=H3ZC73_9ALTE|nr:hypothetical protein [Alishewanella jeotgali]EHR41918.1 CRISPR-associated helicase Cas3 domain protein [Alishewanella jeotgali KCTC 22429]KRS21781.1 hypothetical protein AAY72_06770 [Alishewanella sp. WH16-1]
MAASSIHQQGAISNAGNLLLINPQTWHSKLVSENWDAPIVLTTMVQFLETLLSGGTRGVRRLHQLANSVIVFDEIQTLPINCIHLFNNSLNFLAAHCKTTAVLCTATQPLLHQVPNEHKGRLHLPAGNELMPDIGELFQQLKRVEILDKTTVAGWSLEEITALALEQMQLKTSSPYLGELCSILSRLTR